MSLDARCCKEGVLMMAATTLLQGVFQVCRRVVAYLDATYLALGSL